MKPYRDHHPTDATRRMLLGGLAAAGAGLAGSAACAAPASVPGATPAATGKAAPTDREGSGRVPLLAPTPPMGWNSWNSFGTSINEAQALEIARIQAERLLPSGYSVFTIDIQWYEPQAGSYQYTATPAPTLDDHGRLLPAPNRFPSAAAGQGFAPIARQVHALGLQFGVHLMRGIPRLAVERNLPVLGTQLRAQDVADTGSTCPWNPDMYGVDMRRPGAQAWYDSVFALLASWGVDFVKMDDMSRPYDAHAAEIEAAHRAIERSGRPITLSLSPGETPVARAEHVARHAQMWRISDDFWDEWDMLAAQFTRLENWNAHRRPGAWPDADMLPLGRLALGDRDTRFTPDEQRTLMTLWSIARSPLIMGGDLRHLDEATLALLTNDEVLAVNQRSRDNQPHFLADGLRAWSARPGAGEGAYLAMFNTTDSARSWSFPLERLGLAGRVPVRDLWARAAAGQAEGLLHATVPAHGAVLLALGPAAHGPG